VKIKIQYPFINYKAAYLVINKEPRRNVILVKEDNTKTTMSYARYLMSIHLGRFLTKEEHVDHIDNNKMNDCIENYQILSQLENNRKSSKGRKYIKMRCPNCGKIFDIRYNQSHIQKKGKFSSCSRTCKYEVLKKGYSINQLIEIGNNQIIEQYVKKEN